MQNSAIQPISRRDALRLGLLASVAAPGAAQNPDTRRPWYRRTLRWGQTNINEKDPARYDIDWWRQHWKRTHTQGLVINAGGIVAYYPTRSPLHYQARFLNGRDLYGELTRAAHEDGLAVLARMDSNRATAAFHEAHPDWFAVDADGEPYRADDRYIACIDGPYYEEHLPALLREIIAWERPEGFTDNSWSGLNRDQICHCRHSREKFRNATGRDLPARKDWDDPAYREWIEWSYQRRVEVWDLNNRVTREAGGDDCLWLGMLGGDFISQGRRFRDVRAICRRSEMVMLDDQSRDDWLGFQENAEMGKRLHGLLGWDKIIPESMATYQRGPVFRKAAASPAEARMWMYSGFAGGIQPWWHHVGAYQWDRRQFETAMPVYDWYQRHERYLVNREPVATVGVVYSQRNADFYGRDDARELVGEPYYGVIQALVRARIPYLPVHIDDVSRDAGRLALLVLPNLAAMSDAQVEAVQAYVEGGGSLLASGETGWCDEWGDPRETPALGDLLGVAPKGVRQGTLGDADSWSGDDHTYLRLHPDVGGEVYGPRSGDEPVVGRPRHAVLRGFERTDILAFGGLLTEVEPAPDAAVPATYIPDFPAYPPETSWMRTERTTIPALALRENGHGGRSAYFAADLDRRYARDYLPDHGRLIANTVRWAARGRIPLSVRGRGLIDCHLYRQGERILLHLVNLTAAGAWRSPLYENIPVGPLEVTLRLPDGFAPASARLLAAGRTVPLAASDRGVTLRLSRIVDHELIVIE